MQSHVSKPRSARAVGWLLLALAACGGKVAFDGQPPTGAGGSGGAQTSTVTHATVGATTTTVTTSAATSSQTSTSTSSSGSFCWIADKPSCVPCCTMLPGEYASFQKHLMSRCGCASPLAPCASACMPGGSCLDPLSLDAGSPCATCLVNEAMKAVNSPCLVTAVTEDCNLDCPSFAACEVGCHS